MIKMKIVRKIVAFYLDGFTSMTWGRKLWLIILIKLFIIFAVLKLFFFRDFLGSNFDSEKEKADHVAKELTK